jgi:hypothetical protein
MEIIDENRNINNELSQIIVTNESVFLFEEILFSSDYENDKNWEDYFFFVEEKIKNDPIENDDELSNSM